MELILKHWVAQLRIERPQSRHIGIVVATHDVLLSALIAVVKGTWIARSRRDMIHVPFPDKLSTIHFELNHHPVLLITQHQDSSALVVFIHARWNERVITIIRKVKEVQSDLHSILDVVILVVLKLVEIMILCVWYVNKISRLTHWDLWDERRREGKGDCLAHFSDSVRWNVHDKDIQIRRCRRRPLSDCEIIPVVTCVLLAKARIKVCDFHRVCCARRHHDQSIDHRWTSTLDSFANQAYDQGQDSQEKFAFVIFFLFATAVTTVALAVNLQLLKHPFS